MRIAWLLVSSSFLVAGLATIAAAGPGWDCENVTIPTAGAVLFNRFDGQGHPFTEAQLANGMVVNATIDLTLLDEFGNPLVGFPAEDLWLETTAGGLVFPPLGTIADAATNEFGQTRWQAPLAAGGCSLGEEVDVVFAGTPMNCPMPLAFTSADIDGDLDLDLADVSTFAAAYHGAFEPCCDFDRDGHLDLADLNLFAAAYQP